MSLCPCVCVSWSYNSRTPSFRDVSLSDESTRETRTGERALGRAGRDVPCSAFIGHRTSQCHRNQSQSSLVILKRAQAVLSPLSK